ncbi:MAG: GNAT family N-acetyltransferase [Acidimicrobiaceae bacterium]|nr:GNAT family N-acetyltransferase [Acidimicrobiaceae bacterium]MCY4280256.1 GNAT family N-acetyltransferase [Acidimicrobiaceae bacterium]MCY4293563.1 GNAT family N-acetyltransferase [Acidimicrobiaceae bacterium]
MDTPEATHSSAEDPDDSGDSDDVVVRLATVDDAEALRRIYNHEVEHTTHTFDLVPRSLAEQQAWLRKRVGAHGVLVAETNGRVVGFSALSEYRPRAAYRTSVGSSVYVEAAAQGRGIGRKLMQELVALAQARGFHTMLARIAAGNDVSIQLHAAVGFEKAGIEREVGRKFGEWLDVVVMQRMLP